MFRAIVREGVHLKLLEERHAPAVFAAVDRNRAYLREWLPWVDSSKEVDDTRAFIRTSLERFAKNEGLTAGIWCGGEYAGTIGTHNPHWPNRKVEIGYWLAAEFQGRGIMTDSCRLLIDHAFAEWELNRVEIRCATGNVRSCAIPKRLGFQHEGTLREAEHSGGRYRDLNIYAMLAGDWKVAAK